MEMIFGSMIVFMFVFSFLLFRFIVRFRDKLDDIGKARGQEITLWPKIRASIVSTKVVDKSDISTGITSYIPVIEYRYCVDSIDFVSSGLAPYVIYTSVSSVANEFISKHKVGSSLGVHYNIQDPSISYITQEMDFTKF